MATEEVKYAHQRAVHAELERIYRERADSEKSKAKNAEIVDAPDHPASNQVIDMTPGKETTLQKLLRANKGRTSQATAEPPVTEAELGMSFAALAAMSPAAKLAVANRVLAARRRAAAQTR